MDYVLLGDDILLWGDTELAANVAVQYRALVTLVGVEINDSKGLISSEAAFEFAMKLGRRGKVLTLFHWREWARISSVPSLVSFLQAQVRLNHLSLSFLTVLLCCAELFPLTPSFAKWLSKLREDDVISRDRWPRLFVTLIRLVTVPMGLFQYRLVEWRGNAVCVPPLSRSTDDWNPDGSVEHGPLDGLDIYLDQGRVLDPFNSVRLAFRRRLLASLFKPDDIFISVRDCFAHFYGRPISSDDGMRDKANKRRVALLLQSPEATFWLLALRDAHPALFVSSEVFAKLANESELEEFSDILSRCSASLAASKVRLSGGPSLTEGLSNLFDRKPGEDSGAESESSQASPVLDTSWSPSDNEEGRVFRTPQSIKLENLGSSLTPHSISENPLWYWCAESESLSGSLSPTLEALEYWRSNKIADLFSTAELVLPFAHPKYGDKVVERERQSASFMLTVRKALSKPAGYFPEVKYFEGKGRTASSAATCRLREVLPSTVPATSAAWLANRFAGL
jgi:hypothetical protein